MGGLLTRTPFKHLVITDRIELEINGRILDMKMNFELKDKN